MAMLSVMMFDSPDTEYSSLSILMFWSVFTVPLVLLVSCVGGLIVLSRKDSNQNTWTGRALAMLPLVNVFVFVVATVLIEAVCDGKFSC